MRVQFSFWAFSLFLAVPLAAQVSPGPLSNAHRSLNTTLKCSACHEFGTDTPKLRCLGCHREIDFRINARRGFHGHLAEAATHTVPCAKCHPEHLGEDFDISQRPANPKDFKHSDTGYALTGKHAAVACNKCHQASRISKEEARLIQVNDKNRTYLGLGTACLPCHQDKHEGRFGTDCSRCHTTARWKPATTFNHSETRYPLTGKHTTVDCNKCHKQDAKGSVRYSGFAFDTCTACHKEGTLYYIRFRMAEGQQPRKIPLIFYRSRPGSEPVREWLKELPEVERQAIGKDLLRAQWWWPVGMPLCRPMGSGLWEVRTDLPTKRTARVLLCLYREHLVALHGFIKKTRTTPDEDLALARKRKKELEQ